MGSKGGGWEDSEQSPGKARTKGAWAGNLRGQEPIMEATKRMTLKGDNEGRSKSKEGGRVHEISNRTHGGDRPLYILGEAAPDRVFKARRGVSCARVCRSYGGDLCIRRIPLTHTGYYS